MAEKLKSNFMFSLNWDVEGFIKVPVSFVIVSYSNTDVVLDMAKFNACVLMWTKFSRDTAEALPQEYLTFSSSLQFKALWFLSFICTVTSKTLVKKIPEMCIHGDEH